ncbi:accessory factor UbiK family protein [Sandaracinobacteroides sp. A072]|uniref:accessory factor UbiK family protein n=1 Tax=Sandaracinobacteroides sp. A072 TaxID=3461146 RepID=UPI0040410B05
MQNQNPVFEDLARLMSGIAGTVAGAGREAEARMREKLREAVGGLDMVSREEFEAVKAMAAETRAELEALKARLGPASDATESKATGGNTGGGEA